MNLFKKTLLALTLVLLAVAGRFLSPTVVAGVGR